MILAASLTFDLGSQFDPDGWKRHREVGWNSGHRLLRLAIWDEAGCVRRCGGEAATDVLALGIKRLEGEASLWTWGQVSLDQLMKKECEKENEGWLSSDCATRRARWMR